MSARTWVSAVAAIGAGAALAVAGPALPAVGDSSPPGAFIEVEVGDSATILAKGAGVVVPVDVTCPAGTTGFLNINVTQARGRFTANGFAYEEVACTGETQTVLVTVSAQSGAVKRGQALVDAQLTSCPDFSACSTVRDTEVISLTTAR